MLLRSVIFHRPIARGLQRSWRSSGTPRAPNPSAKDLVELQRMANEYPDAVAIQERFYKSLAEAGYPEHVVTRFQSGKFAESPAIVTEYVRALDQTGGTLSLADAQQLIQRAVSSGRGAVPDSESVLGQLRQELGGSPLPVVVQGLQSQKVSHSSEWWKTLRRWGGYFLVITGIGAIFDSQISGMTGAPGGAGKPGGITPWGVTKYKGSKSDTKFEDVKGCSEAKDDLVEVVTFLKDPQRFTRLGGKLPKGVLLSGPPGTGKTLLARAVAGEAGVPFFYSSGSEFEEMYVGVGARRIRDLFAAAKAQAPAIIFIDEIDAVGGKRNNKDHQSMRMTLNQLLVEMDGFVKEDSIIVIAATNTEKILDKALVRPGRFDRIIAVPLPDRDGRKEIFDLYVSKIKRGPDVDTMVLARSTPGCSGADIDNIVNTAAIKASTDDQSFVSMKEFEYAKDKILMGAERKTIMPEEELRLTAYHEGGHALVALLTDGAMPIHKATIMPRGHTLGMVAQLPEDDIRTMSRKQLLARLDVCMGGRVAEEMIFGEDGVTTGASSDIEQATHIAHTMVLQAGMSEAVGLLNVTSRDMKTLGPELRETVDREIRKLIDGSYARAKKLVKSHEKELHTVATALLKFETLSGDELKGLLAGKQPDRDVKAKA